MHNPWGILRRLTGWTLHWAPLPVPETGLTDHHTRTITLVPGMTQAQRRSTLAHELEHVRRGPGHPSRAEEAACDQGAARAMIDLDALGEAIAWAPDDIEAVADELWVDVSLLKVRLAHLHPSERAKLKRRLADP